MPTTIHNTGITFPDSSTQTTAASGGGPITTQYAIGSYIIGRPADFTNYNNSTIAGSSLYATSGSTIRYNDGEQAPTGWYQYQAPFGSGTYTPPLVNVGSWRCISIAPTFAGGSGGAAGLWVRYA